MGRPKKNQIIDVDKIKKNLDNAIQETGKEVSEEIKRSFVSAVRDFYAAYKPLSYSRTYSTYEASSSASGIPSYKRTGECSCEAGIVVDSKYMGEPYHKNHGWDPSASFIFDRTWNKGIHGFNKKTVSDANKALDGYRWVPGNNVKYDFAYPGLDVSPSDLNGSSFVKNGQRYSRKNIPTNSKPPKKTMNEEFKEIKKSIPDRIDAAFIF